MKQAYFLLLLGVLFGSTSCKKLLDTEVSDFISPENYYSTAEELQTGLNGVYDKLGALEVYGAHLSFRFSSSTDESYQLSSSSESSAVLLYDPSNSFINGFWQQLYVGIDRANLLLLNVDKPDMDEEKRKEIKGQALFLRAYYYFLLAANYGGVPLLLEPTENINKVDIPRATLKDVYGQILKDMTAAEGLLENFKSTNVGFGGKVTRTVVQGILARVCLTMAGYPLRDESKYADALIWSSKVIESKEHSLNPDYKQVFINYAADKYDVKESMWEVEFYGNGQGMYSTETGQAAGLLIGIQSNNADTGICTSNVRITKLLYDSYKVDETLPAKPLLDLRRDWNCPNFTNTGTNGARVSVASTWAFCAGKYRRTYETALPKNKSFTPQNFPLLRYADVLLMYAEAEFKVNGRTDLAKNAINQVRRRGFGKLLFGERLKNLTITNAGTKYTTPPTITISGGGGSGATATATVSGGKITAVTITNKGTFYTSLPTVAITGTGTGAVLTPVISQLTEADLIAADFASDEDFLMTIRKERSRELCFEALRKYDLIRWGVFYSTMKVDFVNYAAANGAPATATTASKNLDQRSLLFPIPSHEMSVNKALVQNPGW